MPGNEEDWDGPCRDSAKSGAIVKPMLTAFAGCKAEDEPKRSIGDSRPFMLHARPGPNSKYQVTAFESRSDEEYAQTLYEMCVQAKVTVP